MPTLLVIDDNEVDREQIRRLLGGRHALIEATTAREGVAAAAAAEVDCVLLDYRLSDEDGVRVIELLRGRNLPIVMLTSQGSEQVAVEALKHGAVDYLAKSGLTRERLQQAIAVAIEQGRLRAELDRHRRELELAVAQLSAQRAELAAAHAALQQREAHLRFVLGQLPVVHWTTDREMRITHLGGAGLEALGVRPEAAIGHRVVNPDFSKVESEECIAAHQQALAGSYGLHRAAVRGRWYQVHVGALRDAAGAIVGTIGLALDVSEARGLEQQLRHAVKMEALGQLAGGIAHDFNNLLSAILGFATFVREGIAPGDALRDDVEQIIGAADRATALVRQLMTFTRRGTAPARVVEVAAVVGATLPMLRRLVGEDVELTHAAEPEPWRARVDPSELEQVVVNLVVNARDAMARGGRLEVDVQHAVLTEALASTREHRLAPGEYVVLCVTDEGECSSPSSPPRTWARAPASG
jgi:PAS domain S-box-containing protein